MKKYQFSSDYKKSRTQGTWKRIKKILLLDSRKIEEDTMKFLEQQKKIGNLPDGIYYHSVLKEVK